MMGMNQEQVLNLVRTFMQIAGSMLVGYHLFGIDSQAWTAITGGVLMATPAIWGVVTNRRASQVAKVNAMPEVAGVITKPSTEGLALANSVPSPTVVPAGTIAATTVAQTTNPTKGD